MRACGTQRFVSSVVLDEGAAAVVIVSTDNSKFAPQPGGHRNRWRFGAVERVPGIIALEGIHKDIDRVYSALVAGATVHVRVQPDPSPWEAMVASPLFVLWQVAMGIIFLSNVELAMTQLWTYAIADGGFQGVVQGSELHLPNALFCLEGVLNALRLAAMADPYYTRGFYEFHVSFALSYIPQVLLTVTSVIFLVHFQQAAANGLAEQRLTSPTQRRFFAGLCASLVLFYVLFEAFVISPTLLMVKALAIAAVYPCIVLVVSIRAELVVRRMVRSLEFPAPLVARLNKRMRLANTLAILQLLLAFGVVWGSQAPWRLLLVWGMYGLVSASLSALRMLAFVPFGVRVHRGPLRRLREAAGRAVWRSYRATRCCARLSSSSKVFPRAEGSPGRTRRAASVLQGPDFKVTAPKQVATPAPTHSHLGVGDARVAHRPSRDRQASLTVPTSRNTSSARSSRQKRIHSNMSSSNWSFKVPPAEPEAQDGRRLLLGVSLAFLRRFSSDHAVAKGARTLDVAAIVAALTVTDQLAIVEEEAARGTEVDGHAAVAGASCFVSHAQSCGWFKLLDALDAHVAEYGLDPAETYFWLDLMCIRQHQVSVDVHHIADVIRSVGRLVLVLDPWDKPVCLSRVWCLYELVHTQLQASTTLHLAMAPLEKMGFTAALARDRKSVHHAILAFDTRDAKATVPQDKDMIFDLITRSYTLDDDAAGGYGAFDHFNADVRAAVMRALAAVSFGG